MRAGKASLIALGVVVVGVSVVFHFSSRDLEQPVAAPSAMTLSTPSASPSPLTTTPTPVREESSVAVFGRARTPENLFVEGSRDVDQDPSPEVKAVKPPSWFIYSGYRLDSKEHVPVFQPNTKGFYPVKHDSIPYCTDISPYRDLVENSNNLSEKLLGAWFRADISVKPLKGKTAESPSRADFGLQVAVSEPMTPIERKAFIVELAEETGVAIENIELIGPPKSFDEAYDWVEGMRYEYDIE